VLDRFKYVKGFLPEDSVFSHKEDSIYYYFSESIKEEYKDHYKDAGYVCICDNNTENYHNIIISKGL